LLHQNKNKIDWNELGHNTAMNTHLLYEGNIDKINNWMPICKNRSAWIVNILDDNKMIKIRILLFYFIFVFASVFWKEFNFISYYCFTYIK